MSNDEIVVLLVDDDEMIRDCVAAYMDDEGFVVRCAVNGEEALEMIYAVHPDVCISDLRLPGMDGDEFIIKAHAVSPATGYLLHTGMLYSLTPELLDLGMTAEDVLLKPVHNLSGLADKIRRIAAAGRGV